MSRSIPAAAAFLWCYAALLVLEAVGIGVARDWADRKHFIQHTLGALAYVVLGWSVRRRQRWAWWVVVLIVGPLGVLGAAAVVYIVSSPAAQRLAVMNQLEALFQFGSSTFPLFVLSVAVLVAAASCLLTREAREAFFPTAPELS